MFQFGFVYVVIGSMEKWFDFGAMSGPPEEPSDPVWLESTKKGG
jgi:hypothetical protein